MSASLMVLDLIRAHYRGDDQLFRTVAWRLTRMTKAETTRKSMVEILERSKGQYVPRPPPGEPLPSSAERRFAAAPPVQPKATASGILETLAEVNIDDLLLNDDVRAHIDEVVLELAHRSELADRGLQPRCRLLFEGPPGNGKTSTASAIAHELGCAAFGVSIPNVISIYVGGTSNNLGTLFSQIDRGSLVVFDEIDAIGGERTRVTQSASAERNTIVNTILTLLDRNTGGTLVATTNRTDVLDPALLRRFDEIITFPGPSNEQMAVLAGRLEEKHKLTTPADLSGCENFDAVTKRVLRDARRQVMAEILAAQVAATDELDDESPDAAV